MNDNALDRSHRSFYGEETSSRTGLIRLADFERRACEVLTGSTWDYYAGGAEDEYTIAENCNAFRRIKLRPRVLVDVRQRDLSTVVLGQRVALPVLLGPTTFQRLAHNDAELATARAAASAGTIAVFNIGSHHHIAEVAAAGGGPLWFQIYCFQDHGITERVIAQAEDAGCLALVVTVDATYPARRERHMRTPFVIPMDVRMGNLETAGLVDTAVRMDEPLMSLTWDDIAWLRTRTRLSLVLKGIMTGEDAALAVEHGVDGIIVSNHGGRQIDGTLASIDMLSEVIERVAGRVEVLVDGGIRRGTDVLKALALGAKAVLIGRPYLWGLAVAGEAGVRQVLDILREETDSAMSQCGVADVKRIDRSLVVVSS